LGPGRTAKGFTVAADSIFARAAGWSAAGMARGAADLSLSPCPNPAALGADAGGAARLRLRAGRTAAGVTVAVASIFDGVTRGGTAGNGVGGAAGWAASSAGLASDVPDWGAGGVVWMTGAVKALGCAGRRQKKTPAKTTKAAQKAPAARSRVWFFSMADAVDAGAIGNGGGTGDGGRPAGIGATAGLAAGRGLTASGGLAAGGGWVADGGWAAAGGWVADGGWAAGGGWVADGGWAATGGWAADGAWAGALG